MRGLQSKKEVLRAGAPLRSHIGMSLPLQIVFPSVEVPGGKLPVRAEASSIGVYICFPRTPCQ